MSDQPPTRAEDRPGPSRRRPPRGRPVPVSTYRLQLGAELTLDDAVDLVPYLDRLGVTHLYLSPVLTPSPGSTHGYDVVDHDEISPVLGGRQALDRLSAAARGAGLGLVVDIVPNHVAVPTPAWHNRALWSVLAHGPGSPYAAWFDVDWSAGDGALLMPVLGRRIGAVLAAEELTLDRMSVPGTGGEQQVLRYYDHVFPVREGTEHLPLAELVERQHYRLAYWRVADEELNYRRFFDVGTLAAIRVEDPGVFDATHDLVAGLVRDGVVDGLRIDHPDGLADPQGYLDRLARATDEAWVVVEKILAPSEDLPEDWATAGTTGYDAAWRVQATFVDPGGSGELGALMHRLTGDTVDALPSLVEEAKREIVTGPLYAEVHRLTDLAAEICRDDVRLRDHTWRSLHECLVELLVAADRYRYYVQPGAVVHPDSHAAFVECVDRARGRLDTERHETLDLLAEMLLGREIGSAGRTREARRDELVVRFQQTCGAVMAKGVEDTTFYRWTHLVGLCEVGGAPERFAISPEELHAWAARTQDHAPVAMTTLSTHDTKRSEDVRARLGVLSELPVEWAELVTSLRQVTAEDRPHVLDGRTENLWWQTLAGTWGPDGPLDVERLCSYLVKAMREAKSRTAWTAVDEAYEDAVLTWARRTHDRPEVRQAFDGWVRRTGPGVRAATLGTKLVQLCFPGIPDVYQGTEVTAVALVDPDNRRPVDHAALSDRLHRLEREAPRDLDDEKLLVTSRALAVRRAEADAFVGPTAGYQPLPSSSGNALAFARTADDEPRAVVVATRLALALERLGGWGEHVVTLPPGRWQDALTGQVVEGGGARLADLLSSSPVALLVRAEADA
ncbi:malto-oligosyltrehalose synthase [Cellulomonas bogoriensis]|uniref:Maltooligosyl trehalose synthase n=1 Tax=Cellulomonas bogoriensis 69B4 = DSM 16987 TaxID=1386082 RepID=A0A0A0BZW1_9CELL|nr:malto-oligosyltrehalose synthase [Cellulomonas bogoriensis]KGM13212.1 maltooligosyl trehalose synthase [Cellulomonas bogoriensis 69B4 = DSM 16987]